MLILLNKVEVVLSCMEHLLNKLFNVLLIEEKQEKQEIFNDDVLYHLDIFIL